ncbi:DegT/DnrJ/EryC1/StrS aminotransferase family protein [Pseudomonas sp. SLFW]|uniref:DegT/DnrJ/EryC1/StrS family aminotransferase n=1 Tax=Pseudomonas sp. SLFW TaxID=2683259 RepID=UPI0014135DBD|nr:DegT/DnrJ/EryC1/StrS aminotransferase family protein [Pseudomonas sp. SLFW]NBB10444.1 aminotransferase class V-fold PLP-dependent enzyme [Pseudomonas sp. SLFW]
MYKRSDAIATPETWPTIDNNAIRSTVADKPVKSALRIPVYQPYLAGQEAEYVNTCLNTNWISSRGEFIQRFEDKFAAFTKASFATAVCNGTTAIHLALAALDIGPGDEVIVPTFTYIASINPILQMGAVPVFVDSLEDTWQMDPAQVEQRITPRTKAIMVVHLYGLPCDMNALSELCKRYNLLMVEDCAEAFGTFYQGQHVGTFGDAATFSFFGNKTITTGEGGMVIARSQSVIERARHLKTQGVSAIREYWHDQLAYNYRMTNLCAAIGVAQLEQAQEILTRKRKIAEWYMEEFAGLPIALHAEQSGTTHSFWMCSALLETLKDRDDLRSHLRASGIETRPLFHPAHTMPHCKSDEIFPVAEMLSERGLNLPSYPALERDDIRYIGDVTRKYFGL